MATYEVQANGKTYEVQAPNLDAAKTAAMKFAGPKSAERPTGYQTAETLHTDSAGKALSFPHQAVPADPEGQGYAQTAALMGLMGPAGDALGAIPGVVGSAARAAMANPGIAGAIIGATPDLLRGNLSGAMYKGGIGALVGEIPGVGGKILQKVGRWGLPAEAAAAETAVPAAARGVSSSGVVPASVPSPTSISGLMTAEVPASAEAAPETVKSLMGTGTATMPTKTANTIIREFAKAAAPAAKKGERIWIRLNSDGLPEDVITPGQASRLASSLKTWVARTW